MDDLLTEWGINPAVERTLSKPARPMNMRNWVPTIRQHFPTGLIVLGRDARVTLRLIVDAEGKQSACRVLRPVVDKSYENLICGILLERAKFAPALDAAGQPVQSLYVSSVVYRLN